MDKQKIPAESRTLGPSCWKQESSGMGGKLQISSAWEKEAFSSKIMEKFQVIFQDCDESSKGFITRADMQKLKENDLPWSTEEMQLVFDGLDFDSKGYLTIEEFTSGIRHFLRSQTVTREHRKRKTALIRAAADRSWEEADIEEQKCFEAFINQLGADNIFEDQSEIWKIWIQLQQDEPHLLGNLKEFLAKLTHLIKEAKHTNEKLQRRLHKQVADHNKEVQQLYEEMEEQIEREKQRLLQESETRNQFHSMEMQKVLDVREREIQRFLNVQKELEIQFLSLKEKQLLASSNNQQLKETNVALKSQLQQILHQLQETQRHLDAMKDGVSQIRKEEGRDLPLDEVLIRAPQTPQAPLHENAMVYSELEVSYENNLSEATLDNSTQQAPDDGATIIEADSKSRRRVISIEEDPLAKSVVEVEQYFLQKPSGQRSLLSELNDAIAALSQVPVGSQEQEIEEDLGFQGPASLHQIRQNEKSQQSITQENVSQYEAHSRNCGPQNISEALITGPASQEENLLKEGSTQEMKRVAISESEKETPQMSESMQGNGNIFSAVQPSVSSVWVTPVSDYMVDSVQGDIWISKQVIQPDLHKHVLQQSDIIQIQWSSADSEQGMEKSPEMKTPDRQCSEPRHPLLKDTQSALPKLRMEHRVQASLFQISHLGSMSGPEKEAQSTVGTEVPITEDRSRGKVDVEKIPKIPAETNFKPEVQDCQVNERIQETSKLSTGACSHPDHLYNVLFVGNSNVGKTSFLCRLHNNSFSANMTATIGMDYRIKNLFVDNKCFALRLWDTAGQERYHSVTKQFFRKADGVALMYDISSPYSFADVRYWLDCIQEGAGNDIVILLLGNKTDCTAERRVSIEDGVGLAKEYGLSFYECSAASGHNVSESMVKLVRLLKAHEDNVKQKVLELPVQPKKKRGCCSGPLG